MIGVDEYVRTLRSPDAVKTIKIPLPKCRIHPQKETDLFCETCNETMCTTYVSLISTLIGCSLLPFFSFLYCFRSLPFLCSHSPHSTPFAQMRRGEAPRPHAHGPVRWGRGSGVRGPHRGERGHGAGAAAAHRRRRRRHHGHARVAAAPPRRHHRCSQGQKSRFTLWWMRARRWCWRAWRPCAAPRTLALGAQEREWRRGAQRGAWR